MAIHRGMTFLEVMIAIVVVAMVLSAMFTGITFATKYARHNANKTMAINFAQYLMEEIRNTSYSDLGNYNGYLDAVLLYQGPGVTIQAARTAAVVTTEPYKNVTVTVTWAWLGKQYIEVLNTLRYNY